jgi:predicted permease
MDGLDLLGVEIKGPDALSRLGKTVRFSNVIGSSIGLITGVLSWKAHRVWGAILGGMAGGAVGAVAGVAVGAKLESNRQKALQDTQTKALPGATK